MACRKTGCGRRRNFGKPPAHQRLARLRNPHQRDQRPGGHAISIGMKRRIWTHHLSVFPATGPRPGPGETRPRQPAGRGGRHRANRQPQRLQTSAGLALLLGLQRRRGPADAPAHGCRPSFTQNDARFRHARRGASDAAIAPAILQNAISRHLPGHPESLVWPQLLWPVIRHGNRFPSAAASARPPLRRRQRGGPVARLSRRRPSSQGNRLA